jgi:hypothetical protein
VLAVDRYRWWLLGLGVGLVALLVLTSCSAFNDDRGIGDAPADQQPDADRKVWPMPDQFANIAGLCIGGNGVYVTTREAAPAVVADDPECAPGGALAVDEAPE